MSTATLTNTITGMVAFMLIVLPMSVFAQSNTLTPENEAFEITQDSIDIEAVSIQDEAISLQESDAMYDNYKREKLPDSNIEFNDFVVGPGYLSLEVAPGESKTILLKVSNRMGEGKLFSLTTEDMTNNDDGGGMKFLGDEVGPYTLKDYISVDYDQFYLEDNKRAIVPVTISIPADAEPGGFYGSILTQILSTPSNEGDSDVAPSAPLVSRIGTLFYVTTSGDVDRNGSFVDFKTIPDKSLYMSGPIDMGIVFENTGSVHFTPYGTIEITNLLGDTVGQVELDPWFVMPQSLRTKELSWNREFLIGRYVVTADLNLGYDDVSETKTLVFWVFPWKFLSAVFAGVFVFFLLIRFIFRNFEFNRKQ